MTAPVTASGHESGEGDRVTVSGHGDLPDKQGITNAPAETGSDPKTATDLVKKPSESERDATDSGQKTRDRTREDSNRDEFRRRRS